jgi:plasmid maintenance system antidote protein VapI
MLSHDENVRKFVNIRQPARRKVLMLRAAKRLTTPDFWLNLQSEFDLRVVRNQKEAKVRNQVRPLEVHA